MSNCEDHEGCTTLWASHDRNGLWCGYIYKSCETRLNERGMAAYCVGTDETEEEVILQRMRDKWGDPYDA